MWRTRAGLLTVRAERDLSKWSGRGISSAEICCGLGWEYISLSSFLFFFFLVGEPPVREPPRCTSQSEEENFLVGLSPHTSMAGDVSRDPVSLCRDKAGHLGVMELNSREGVSRHAGQRGEPARHCQCTHHKKRQQWNAGP